VAKEDLGGLEGPFDGAISDAVANQEAIFRNTFPGALGVVIEEAGPGRAVGTVDVGPSVLHPGGFAHGGALAGFGDTVAAWATFPALKDGEIFTTIEFKANFISSVQEGTLRAEAVALHAGSRTHVIEVKITTADDPPRLVSVMTVTQAILRGRA
jgi:1,4-dihydroxy-2-naphthoyl-CoA hydrolase